MNSDAKPRTNRKLYVEVLRRMSPQERWDKAFELTAHVRDLFETGLRIRHPEKSDAELKAFMLKRLARCHNRNW